MTALSWPPFSVGSASEIRPKIAVEKLLCYFSVESNKRKCYADLIVVRIKLEIFVRH